MAVRDDVNQYDARPNRIFIEYLIYPKEVIGTLAGGYAWQFTGAIVAVAVLSVLFRRRLLADAAPARPMHFVAAAVISPVLFALCLLSARSTLDHRAVNASTVAVSTDPMVNDLALNSTYSLL